MTEAPRGLERMDHELRKVPEVASVSGKIGRADTATDPAPTGMAGTVLLLKPRSR
jgi:copper/silver efflux system protein